MIVIIFLPLKTISSLLRSQIIKPLQPQNLVDLDLIVTGGLVFYYIEFVTIGRRGLCRYCLGLLVVHLLKSILLFLDDGVMKNLLVGKALCLLGYSLINLRDHLLQLLMLFSRHQSRLTLILQAYILTSLLAQNQLSKLSHHWCLSGDRLEDVRLRFTSIEHAFVLMLRGFVLNRSHYELGKLLRLWIFLIGSVLLMLGVSVKGINSQVYGLAGVQILKRFCNGNTNRRSMRFSLLLVYILERRFIVASNIHV